MLWHRASYSCNLYIYRWNFCHIRLHSLENSNFISVTIEFLAIQATFTHFIDMQHIPRFLCHLEKNLIPTKNYIVDGRCYNFSATHVRLADYAVNVDTNHKRIFSWLLYIFRKHKKQPVHKIAANDHMDNNVIFFKLY